MSAEPMLRRRDVAKVFLETTIQIERFLETPQRRAEITKNLINKTLYTSSYVRMEFQRTFLQDLHCVLSLVESECSIDDQGRVALHELMAKSRRLHGRHSQRAVNRCLMIIERLLEIFNEGLIKRRSLLQFLAGQILDLKEDFLEVDSVREGGDIREVEYSNLTDCDLVKNEKCTCRREFAQCSLPRLLKQHAETLEQVREAFAEASLSRRSGAKNATALSIDRISEGDPIDWNMAKGQQNCWPLGDTIIALESPTDSAIYTTNLADFEVICPIVGRVLYEEPVSSSQ